MGVVRPTDEFIQELRQICSEEKIILIFDEVMTDSAYQAGSARNFECGTYMVTFGKIIGGGLPVGAFGGKREIMEMVSPAGPVYQAGTLSGNPLAMAAGYAALNTFRTTGYL